MAGFNNLADVYRSQDRLTILAIADVKRHEYLPDVPTLQELGYNVDDASVNFRGYALPKGVDPSIVDKAAKIVPVMFHDPEVVKRMKDSGRKRIRRSSCAHWKEKRLQGKKKKSCKVKRQKRKPESRSAGKKDRRGLLV